jgi:hypothetical protein
VLAQEYALTLSSILFNTPSGAEVRPLHVMV